MREKKMKDKQLVETQPVPMKVDVVERLSEQDKAMLDLTKAKRETALANAKAALAQNEASELGYNNVILQFALRYGLVDGDQINDDGTIKRKSVQPNTQ